MRRRRVQFETDTEVGVEVVESSSDPVILEIELGVGKIPLDICGGFHVHAKILASGRKAEIPSD